MERVKKEKVIGVRVTAEQYELIQGLVQKRFITPSTLGRVLFEKFIREEVQI